MSPLSIIALVLLAIVLVLLIVAVIWWLRTQGGAAIRSFYGAVRHMEQEQGTRDRYQMPWLLMLGNETDGAQLCASGVCNRRTRPPGSGAGGRMPKARCWWCPRRCSCPMKA